METSSVSRSAHFSFDLLGPHKGFLNLTECAHVHEFRKHLLTKFTVYLKSPNAPWVASNRIVDQSTRLHSLRATARDSGAGLQLSAVQLRMLYCSIYIYIIYNIYIAVQLGTGREPVMKIRRD